MEELLAGSKTETNGGREPVAWKNALTELDVLGEKSNCNWLPTTEKQPFKPVQFTLPARKLIMKLIKPVEVKDHPAISDSVTRPLALVSSITIDPDRVDPLKRSSTNT